MDLKTYHEFTDSLFDVDKNTGELGKQLSILKDHFTALHKDFTEKDSLIQQQKEELTVLNNKNAKLIEANGEMLLRMPVKQETVFNAYETEEPDKPGIDQLLKGVTY
jgi:predicted nuclease with TOPRIM domain